MKLTHPPFSQFVLEEEQKNGGNGQLTRALLDIGIVGKIISREMNKAGLVNIFGHADVGNESGDEVMKLDILANDLFKEYLERTGHFAAMASEEEENFVVMESGAASPYVIAFDPIDGSSNIDYNVSVGTIFSIHRRVDESAPVTEADFLQAGSTQIAAGYIIYGSSTIFVYTTGSGVHGFTLDQSIGEWLLSHPSIMFPDSCHIYSANEAYYNTWDAVSQAFLDDFKVNDPQVTSRHIGSLVADLHRNLLKGGLHFRPYDNAEEQKAKLRINFELKPFAFIVEQAGGYASDGLQSMMDIVPESLHQKSPFFAGPTEYVRAYEAARKNAI